MSFGVLGVVEDVMFGVMMPSGSMAFHMRVQAPIVGSLVMNGMRMKFFALALLPQGLVNRFGHGELHFQK